MDAVDHAIARLKPDSWKGYTIGDPLFPSKRGSYWRLDDEKLMYPFYEKIVRSGINTVCIHKGLLPLDYEKSWPGVWEYATPWDVGKVAKDWPQINWVMYHGALRAFLEPPDVALAEFEQTGRIKWATDLAEILEIPDAMRRRHNFAALGPADGVVKSAIFSGNAARPSARGAREAQRRQDRRHQGRVHRHGRHA